MKNQISVREAISAEETARFWRELGAYHDRDIFANAESEEREYFHGSEYREAVQAAHDRAADRCAELVKALNAKGYRAETPAEFKAAFADAMKQKGPSWIDCRIGKDEKVLPMIPGGGSINDIIME